MSLSRAREVGAENIDYAWVHSVLAGRKSRLRLCITDAGNQLPLPHNKPVHRTALLVTPFAAAKVAPSTRSR
jgi:hypothetical protein